MRILWLCNMPLSFICTDAKLPISPVGGWLSGAYEGIRQKSDITLGICFPALIPDKLKTGTVNCVSYFCFQRKNKQSEKTCAFYERIFRYVLSAFKPDIVHIFGTEYVHTLAMTRAFRNPDKTIVNIQGLVGIYAKHMRADVPARYFYGKSIRNVIKHDSLYEQMKQMERRGKYEREAIKNCEHIIGRTDWDKACTEQANPDAQYHFCNETLRASFYENHWEYSKCEPYSIFVSQSSTPIKGLHYLLRAMPEILCRFPSAKIYTTGRDPYQIVWYKRSEYDDYLIKLREQNGLRDNIIYLNTLSEQKMCEQYLHSNVFVSSSTIENSPNSVGEAMLLGLPTISSDVGGVKNILEHFKEGYIYPHDEPYMLAHYVCQIFSDPMLAIQFGEKARTHAQKVYDIKINADTLFNIYCEVLQ